MNLPDNTEVIGLRLELGRERDRANAFEAALRKEVLAVVRSVFANSEQEVSRLKAEVERLRKAGDAMFNAIILNSDKDIASAMDGWLAAKEGKQP